MSYLTIYPESISVGVGIVLGVALFASIYLNAKLSENEKTTRTRTSDYYDGDQND